MNQPTEEIKPDNQFVLTQEDIPTLQRLATLAEGMVNNPSVEATTKDHSSWLKGLCDGLIEDMTP